MNLMKYIRNGLLLAGALFAAQGAFSATAQAASMDYGVDVVTSYVSRGEDFFEVVADAKKEDRGTFTMAPAVQPALTFYAPSNFSIGLWGSFATTGRDPKKENLGSLDELDLTLSYAFENKVGNFTGGYSVYTMLQPGAPSNYSELFFTWAFPVMKSLKPTLSYFTNPDPTYSSTYTKLAISGGESLTWGLSAGMIKNGLKDVTAKLGFSAGSISVSLNAAMRPNPSLLAGADADGKYISAKDGVTKAMPGTVAWLTISYAGSVE